MSVKIPAINDSELFLYKNLFLFSYLEKILLLCCDVVGFVGLFLLARFVRFGDFSLLNVVSLHFMLMIMFLLGLFYVFDLYKCNSHIAGLRAPGRAIFVVLISAILTILLVFGLGPDNYLGQFYGRGVLSFTFISFAIWAALSRFYIVRWILSKRKSHKWLVLSTLSQLKSLHRDIAAGGLNFSFTYLLGEEARDVEKSDLPIAGYRGDIPEWLNRFWTGGVIVDEQVELTKELTRDLMALRLKGIRVYSMAEFYESTLFKLPLFSLQDSWVVMTRGFDLLHNPVGQRAKRVGDILLSLLLLVISLPIMLIFGFLVWATSKGPVFYRQVRVGRRGQRFSIYKFRSMTVDAEKDGARWASQNDTRVTWIGNIIRKARIDELPQIINVLKGEMSFIGPRPERPEFIDELQQKIPYYNLRHLVKPGITGWAQVYYPYGASVEDAIEKMQYDLFYVKNYSILMDYAILLKTVRVILFGKGR